MVRIHYTDETAYMKEVWGREKRLLRNISQTKELRVDFSRKQQRATIIWDSGQKSAHLQILGATISQELAHHRLQLRSSEELTLTKGESIL